MKARADQRRASFTIVKIFLKTLSQLPIDAGQRQDRQWSGYEQSQPQHGRAQRVEQEKRNDEQRQLAQGPVTQRRALPEGGNQIGLAVDQAETEKPEARCQVYA